MQKRSYLTHLLYAQLAAFLFTYPTSALESGLRGREVKTQTIDLRVEGVSAAAAVQMLHAKCVAVSFIEVPQPLPIRLDVRHATASEVLRQIAAQEPIYRAETIAGRDVLYPARPEFQAEVKDVQITALPRQLALERYVAQLGEGVSQFRDLLPQIIFGNSRAPVYTERVTLRKQGRVIEHFVDLLGEDQDLYFEFIKARSGLPSLVFGRVHCTAVPQLPPHTPAGKP